MDERAKFAALQALLNNPEREVAPEGWTPDKETDFQQWFAQKAQDANWRPTPDAPGHQYNYRHAYEAGAGVGDNMHWPSKFKMENHPNRYIDGVDTLNDFFVGLKNPGVRE